MADAVIARAFMLAAATDEDADRRRGNVRQPENDHAHAVVERRNRGIRFVVNHPRLAARPIAERHLPWLTEIGASLLVCSPYLPRIWSYTPLVCSLSSASFTASRSCASVFSTGIPESPSEKGAPISTMVLGSCFWKYGSVSLPCTAASRRPDFNCVRASTDPSVPITTIAGLFLLPHP